MNPLKILIIATSHEQLGTTGRKTGLWLEELAVPYYLFTDAGAILTIASPKGGPIPLDRKSESIIVSNTSTKRFQKDPAALSALAFSVPLQSLIAEDFDLVFLTGGHGTLWDFPTNEPLRNMLESFNRQDKLIGAICHGVAALLSMKNLQGEPFVKGRKLTGFSNTEEQISALTEIVPFLLETELLALGALYSKGADFTPHIVVDGNLVTGQNPSSSRELAKMLLGNRVTPFKKADTAHF